MNQVMSSTVVLGESTHKQVMDQGRLRLCCVALVFVLSFLAISVRVVELSLPGEGQSLFARQQTGGTMKELNLLTLINGSKEDLAAIVEGSSGGEEGLSNVILPRVDIVDRHGMVLATSLETASVYADARDIRDPAEVARVLAKHLPDLNIVATEKKLASKRPFVWVRRNLTPKDQQVINDLGIPGIHFTPEYARVYPHNHLFSHALGFVGVDNKGLAGVEKYFDERLRQNERSEPLSLSLDLRIQHLVHDELARTVKEFKAIGGTGVVVSVKTGEVLAMASLPDFDPNHPAKNNPKHLFNPATLGVYEMGSSFKTFTLAQAFEYGIVGMRDGYDTTNPIRIANFTISDYHPKAGWMSVPEIFAESSNIGTVKMIMEIGAKRQKSFMKKLGMFKPLRIELPEVSQPLYPKEWRKINMMTISYGHGISVSPLHLVRGIAGVVNDGNMMKLSLLEGGAEHPGKPERIVSVETSHKVRRLLRSVVQYGTGKKGAAPGYRVGGKTGTAEKVKGKSYKGSAKLASFVGVFPSEDPEYVVLVMIDEPVGNKSTYGFATGGWVAAPAVSRIVSQMAPMVGVQPVFDMAPDSVDRWWEQIRAREKAKAKAKVHATSF